MLIITLLSFAFLMTFRIAYLIFFNHVKLHKRNAKTLIVMGSGGHTLEMLKQIQTLNPTLYQPRLYVMADNDSSSEYKVKELESDLQKIKKTTYNIMKIPRSRIVNQSYFSSVFTTLYSILMSVPVVFNFKPDLILCNGPGTCIPICAVAFLLNIVFLCKSRIVFVESICRVKTLSLSGKILLYFADRVIVQWSNLKKNYPTSIYLGRLI